MDMWYIISILIVLNQQMPLTLQQCETCPYVQHGESCYYFSTPSLTHSDAFSNCVRFGYHLVYIETAEEQDFIEGSVKENNVGDYWIGLTVDSDGQGVWMDRSSLTYDNTRDNSYNGGVECFRIVASSGHWHDKVCDESYRYVCEKENACSTETTVATTKLVTTTATTTTQPTTTKPTTQPSTTAATTTTQFTTTKPTTQPSTTTATTTTQSTTAKPTTQPSTTTATTTTQPTTTKPTTQPSTTTSATTTTTTASPKARQRSNLYKIIAQDKAIMDSAVVKRYSTSTLIRCAALCLATESCWRFTFSADNGDCLLGGVAPNEGHDFERRSGAQTFEVIEEPVD